MKVFANSKLTQSGGEEMEPTKLSGGSMIGLAIIIAIVIIVFPMFIYWYAWLAVFMLFIGGIVALMQQ